MDQTRIMGGDEPDLTFAHLTANSDCSNQLWPGSEHVATNSFDKALCCADGMMGLARLLA